MKKLKSRQTTLKPIPKFQNEDEEFEFWSTHDATDYFDLSKAVRVNFPNLKFSTKPITLRLPLSLLDDLKMAANRRDVPYQSLMKVWLAEKLQEEQARKSYLSVKGVGERKTRYLAGRKKK